MPDSQSPKTAPAATDIQVGGAAPAAAAPASVIDKAREQIGELTGTAAEAARNAAAQGKDKAVEALGDLSRLANDAAETIDAKVGGSYGDYARRASAGVQSFADGLQGKDIDQLVEDGKTFVRKSPLIAVGAAAAVGFVLTRILKLGASGGRA